MYLYLYNRFATTRGSIFAVARQAIDTVARVKNVVVPVGCVANVIYDVAMQFNVAMVRHVSMVIILFCVVIMSVLYVDVVNYSCT